MKKLTAVVSFLGALAAQHLAFAGGTPPALKAPERARAKAHEAFKFNRDNAMRKPNRVVISTDGEMYINANAPDRNGSQILQRVTEVGKFYDAGKLANPKGRSITRTNAMAVADVQPSAEQNAAAASKKLSGLQLLRGEGQRFIADKVVNGQTTKVFGHFNQKGKAVIEKTFDPRVLRGYEER